MTNKRIRNIVLVVGVGFGAFSLGCALSPNTQAVPPAQYKAVKVRMDRLDNSSDIQQALDQQSSEGWSYVGEAGSVLIFKK